MREAGMEEMDTYIYRRQNTADQYIVTWTILDLFLEVGKHPGERVVKWWWDQEGLSLAVTREAAEVGGTGEVGS